jgi:hypothetical protein
MLRRVVSIPHVCVFGMRVYTTTILYSRCQSGPEQQGQIHSLPRHSSMRLFVLMFGASNGE